MYFYAGPAGVGATGRDGICAVGSDPRGVFVGVAAAIRPPSCLARCGRGIGGQGPGAASAAAGAIRPVHTTSTGRWILTPRPSKTYTLAINMP